MCLVDVVIVYEVLIMFGKVDDVGGFVYLNVFVQNMLSVVNICCYVEIVCDCVVLCWFVLVVDEILVDVFNLQGKEVC